MTEHPPASLPDCQSNGSRVRWQRDLLIALTLAVVTFLVFIQTRQFDFIDFDDPQYVTQNDRVLSGLSWSNVRWAFTTFKTGNWHPITWLSHMLDTQLFGTGPAGPHVTSVVIHCINVALVYLVLMSMTCRPWRCAIVAALFGLHPLRMESVAWISERKDVLCAMFFLVTLFCYARYAACRSIGWYLAALLIFALSLMSKSMAVTLPCVLLLLDAWPLDRWRQNQVGRLIIEKLPFFALSIACAAVTYIAQKNGGAMTNQRPDLWLRICNAILAVGRYLMHTVWPSGLAVFYPYLGELPGTHLPWSHTVISAVVMLLITIIAALFWRRDRALMIGWPWFLGMLVPVIGLVQVGTQSMADRYTYLPHIGLLIAIVWGIGLIAERFSSLRRATIALAGIVIVLLAICTAYQLRYWQNGYRLFRHALDSTTHNYIAATNIASWLRQHGQSDDAMQYYIKAVQIAPATADTRNNLGSALLERGDLAGARKQLAKAVSLNPNYADARNNYANVLSAQGDNADAIAQYRQAIHLDPSMTEAYFNLGVTLATIKQTRDAIGNFEHAITLRPTYLQARYALALALAQAGELSSAEMQMKMVLNAKPDWAQAMGRFAWMLATSPDARHRDPLYALQLAQRANELTMNEQPHLLDALAAALAAGGRFDEAVDVARRASQIADSHGDPQLSRHIDLRIKLYLAHRVYVIDDMPSTTSPARSLQTIPSQ